MHLAGVRCLFGHHWQADESSTTAETVLRCERCGRRQLAPEGTALQRRTTLRGNLERRAGPFYGRR
jgi:hypothetical protein